MSRCSLYLEKRLDCQNFWQIAKNLAEKSQVLKLTKFNIQILLKWTLVIFWPVLF